MNQLTIECALCHREFPATVVKTTRDPGVIRVRDLEAECDRHGLLQGKYPDSPFETGVDLKLDSRGYVKCPKCNSDSLAEVLRRQTSNHTTTLTVEAECETCGLFYGIEVTNR
jgi:uncharacterized Zn finger protein